MYKIKNLIILKKKMISKNIKIKKSFIKKIKIYIKKGGCSGFKYNILKFKFLKKFNILINIKKINILIDDLSKIYINNSLIIFKKNSNFLIKNNNIKTKCNCGFSFNIK